MKSSTCIEQSLSIVICTYNRSELLSKCLQSLLRERRIDECVVTVVDNGSTDDTKQVCETLSSRFSAFNYVVEPRPGLSLARNRGLAECDTEFLAYLDDDVVVEPGWVEELLAAFEQTGADILGGPIQPYWNGKPPWWVSEGLMPFFSKLDLGQETRLLEGFPPFGGNMAFRSQTLRCGKGFDPELGVCGTERMSQAKYLGEETQLVMDLLNSGFVSGYAGRACVQHLTHGRMRTLRGLRQRAVQLGRTAARNNRDPEYRRACEDEWVWCVACAACSLLAVRVREAIVYYTLAVVSGTSLREWRADSDNPFQNVANAVRSVIRLRRGLIGLLRNTLVGSPPSVCPQATEEHSAVPAHAA